MPAADKQVTRKQQVRRKKPPQRQTLAVQAPKAMQKFPYAKPLPAPRGDVKSKADLHKGRRPAYKAVRGDTKSAGEFKRAKEFKRTPEYKRAVRRVYMDVSPERRRKILEAPPSPEKTQAQKVRNQRVARQRELEKSRAQHDITTDADLAVSKRLKFTQKKDLEAVKRKTGKGVGRSPLRLASIPFVPEFATRHPEETLKHTGKILESSARELHQLPGSVVPTAVHLSEPVVKNPTSPKAYGETAKRVGEASIALPKEYVKAYKKKGLKGVGETFEKQPLASALTVAPIPRGPGLIAGGVARRVGKMPHAAEKTLVGTNLKVRPPTSKSYFKARKQSKESKQISGRDIEHRVDAHVARVEDLSRREHAKTYRQVYKKRKGVVGKKQAVEEAKVAAGKAAQAERLKGEHDLIDQTGITTKPQVKYTSTGHIKEMDPGGQPRRWDEHKDASIFAEKYNAKYGKEKGGVDMVPIKTEGGYAVIPKAAEFRWKQHEAVPSVGWAGAMAKGYNNIWRKNVLATHPTWYVGNTVEAALRSLVYGVGPTSFVRGYWALNRLKHTDPTAYKEATANITKGGHLAMQAHIPGETKLDITGEGFLADTARKVQAFRHNPKGPKQVADLFNNLTELTMGSLSGRVESFFQTGMLGKALSHSHLANDKIIKTSSKAMDDYAKGLRETHNQIALGKEVDKMYGEYGKFSPQMRKLIAHYTPFIAWTLNALRFVYHSLPKDHPVLTAAIASSQTYVDEWLKDEGLNKFVAGRLPPFLQGAIPTEEGFARYPGRYTPFAVASTGPTRAVSQSVLPQFSDVLNLTDFGINWKGQPIKNPDGSPLDDNQLAIAGALHLLEGLVPASQQFIGAPEKYEKGERKLKKIVKPKPKEDIERAFNPFAKVKKKEPTSGGGGGGGSIYGGGSSGGSIYNP